jgi:hypothetical protein
LTKYPAEGPDRNVFSLRDDYQTRRIAAKDHRPVASFTTAWRIFETGVSKRGNDLSG